MPNIYLSPEDRASNTYAPAALWNGKPTNEKEQMCRCADLLEAALTRCGFAVRNVQRGNMYDRVKESNAWPADLHMALHTNGFDGRVSGTRVHCYPSDESRRIGRLIQDRIAPLSPGTSERLVESAGLYELRASHMPAVLPEFGFHDNPEEASGSSTACPASPRRRHRRCANSSRCPMWHRRRRSSRSRRSRPWRARRCTGCRQGPSAPAAMPRRTATK